MNRISLLLFSLTIFLSILGLFIIYESSSYTALFQLNDKYYFIKNQFIWTIAGIFLCLIVSKYDYKKLYNFSLPLLLVTFFLLALVFLPGIGMELKGAHRWIDLRFTVLQPSEILKISLALYLAAWLSNKEKNKFFAFLLLFLISLVLVALEPDLGTAMIVGITSVVVYFLSGAKIRDLILIFLILIFTSMLLIKIEPYRVARLASFQNVDMKLFSDSSYHIKQVLIALGSGGLTGVGPGNSIQKYSYLPESTTDSIFSIYAEETGFIGGVFLILLFLVYVFVGYLISVKTENKFGMLLACGIVTFIGAQAFINLASQVVLIPLTGVPLPFISYGGSSTIINFLSVGMLLNIGNKIKI